MKRKTYHQIYLHFVWATSGRVPAIEPKMEKALYRIIKAQCRKLNCIVKAIGGTRDHIHLLVKAIPAVSPSQLMKQVKGASSFQISDRLLPGSLFKWQQGFGVFSVGERDVPNVMRYILNQKAHHANDDVIPGWEEW